MSRDFEQTVQWQCIVVMWKKNGVGEQRNDNLEGRTTYSYGIMH